MAKYKWKNSVARDIVVGDLISGVLEQYLQTPGGIRRRLV